MLNRSAPLRRRRCDLQKREADSGKIKLRAPCAPQDVDITASSQVTSQWSHLKRTVQTGVSGDDRGRVVWAAIAWHHAEPSAVSAANDHGLLEIGSGDGAQDDRSIFRSKGSQG
jgi:hypothetical protein